MYNTGEIEELREALELIKKGKEIIAKYCTEDCENCPLYEAEVCGYEVDMPIDADANITYGVLDEFVEYHSKVEAKADRQTFREATGIDPAWYDFNEDRTGDR